MTQWIDIRNQTRDNTLIVRAKWCKSFLCRLRGLTFRRSLAPLPGLLLVQSGESVAEATIHMFGVFFSIGVVWIDASKRVVDLTIADPWKIYAPNAPAQYVLEGKPEIIDQVRVGDILEFSEYEVE
jgi:uncharacterized membrane protein (UPF0127 family)